MKRFLIFALPCIVLAILAAYIPLGEYTSVATCYSENTPTIRRRLILGETLDQIRERDTRREPAAVCSFKARYVQYIY